MSARKKSYAKTKKKFESVIAAFVIVAIALITYFLGPDIFDNSQRAGKIIMDGSVQVHFIDVGQGDSALIVTPNGEFVLIDAGPNSNEDNLVEYLNSQGVDVIEYAVMTHPHEDHIGGADSVINAFDVKNVIMPDSQTDTVTFEKMLNAIDENNVNLIVPYPGQLFMIGEVTIKILAPVKSYSDLNNSSIVLRLDYGGTSFMFTGDAEKSSENDMLANYDQSEFNCDVLKVGHHGSNTSSTSDFINAVNPSVAVISCAEINSYGHPHNETIATLENIGAEVYRTSTMGTVVFKADGAEVVPVS